MIPNIFVSSTIADLTYLRDAIREAILDLRYRPVMSDYAEVGYIRPETAADACFNSVSQCHLMVLIIGKRYGVVTKNGKSVTHNEYLTAQQSMIPTITFVDPMVRHYRELFQQSPESEIWNSVAQMDNPKLTFEFLNDVNSALQYNSIISVESANDAKEKLKLQLADFVGSKLAESISPMSGNVKEILLGIKNLEKKLSSKTSGTKAKDDNAKKYMAAYRYLLNDGVEDYRSVLERLFGDLDIAVEKVWNLPTLERVVKAAGGTIERKPDAEMLMGSHDFGAEQMKRREGDTYMDWAHFRMDSGFGLFSDKRLQVGEKYFKEFDNQQRTLYARTRTA